MGTLIYIALIVGVICFPIIFFVTYLRTIEKRAERIIQSISENVKAQHFDTKVWFKSFDIFKRKNTFSIDPFKTLYSFNQADLYVLKNKLVVVGKTKMLGRIRLLSPFAICWGDSYNERTSIKYLTKQTNTELVGSDIEIQFEDLDYTNKIKLVVKKIGEKLYGEIQSGS